MSTPEDVSQKSESTSESSIFSWKEFGKRLMQVGKTAILTTESIRNLEKENDRLQHLIRDLAKELVNLQISVAENKARTDARFENINERIDLKFENASAKLLNGSILNTWSDKGSNATGLLSSSDKEPVNSLSKPKPHR